MKVQEVKVNPDGKRLVNYFESEFKCMGICTSTFFYFTTSIAEGMPKNACLSALWGRVGGLLGKLGTPPVIAGAFLFLALVVKYPLWCYDAAKAEGAGGPPGGKAGAGAPPGQAPHPGAGAQPAAFQPQTQAPYGQQFNPPGA